MQVVLEVHKSEKILLHLQRKENFREGAAVGSSMPVRKKNRLNVCPGFGLFLPLKHSYMKEIVSLDQLDVVNGRYSYADYLTWKIEQTVELIKGKILAMSAPSRYHQRISWLLSGKVYTHFKNHPCHAYAAPFDVRLYDKRKSAKANKDVYSVVQPDLCVICDLEKLDEKGCLGAPDLVVEILSRGNSTKEMKIKKQLYEESGIREYWILDPEHEYALQFHLTEAGVYSPATICVKEEVLISVVFPDLNVPLEEIFVGD